MGAVAAALRRVGKTVAGAVPAVALALAAAPMTVRLATAYLPICSSRQADRGSSPGRESGKMLTARTTLVTTLAGLTSLGSVILLYAAHRPAALVAFTAAGVFGVALKFFDWLIELLHYSIESPGNGIGTYLRISALLLSACPDHCQDAH